MNWGWFRNIDPRMPALVLAGWVFYYAGERTLWGVALLLLITLWRKGR
jgi:hypothetical protein